VTNPLKMRGIASTMNKTSTASKVGSTRYGRARACSKALNFCLDRDKQDPPPISINFLIGSTRFTGGSKIGLRGAEHPCSAADLTTLLLNLLLLRRPIGTAPFGGPAVKRAPMPNRARFFGIFYSPPRTPACSEKLND